MSISQKRSGGSAKQAGYTSSGSVKFLRQGTASFISGDDTEELAATCIGKDSDAVSRLSRRERHDQ